MKMVAAIPTVGSLLPLGQHETKERNSKKAGGRKNKQTEANLGKGALLKTKLTNYRHKLV
jgi:hypothetical protein